jgi:hypothetical protein
MLCVNSHYLDEHLDDIGKQDASIERINSRIAELTSEGGKWFPFTRENIGEALGQLSDSQEMILQHSLENGINEIGLMIGNWVTQYCELQAEKEAIKELSE